LQRELGGRASSDPDADSFNGHADETDESDDDEDEDETDDDGNWATRRR
jgi:hypothetical protein